MNGLERVLRDIGCDHLVGDGLTQEVASAIADNYPPPSRNGSASASTGRPTVAAVPVELDALLAEPDPEHDWALPGLLERGDRVILTGREGDGKSTLLRQIGVQAASGIHPFTLEPIVALRVLLVDCENGRRHVKRKLRPLRDEAGDRYDGNLRVHIASAGIDLTTGADRDLLAGLHAETRPDLTLIGPTYKLATGDPTREETARTVANALDELRRDHNATFLIEAHTPYTNTNGKREIRPYGASLWSRWPEFGIFLGPDGRLEHWRGPRDERAWPTHLERGTPWPWSPSDNDEGAPPDGVWKPTALMERVSDTLAELNAAGEYPSRTRLQQATIGKKGYVLTAITHLIGDLHVDVGTDGKHLELVRPYPATKDNQ